MKRTTVGGQAVLEGVMMRNGSKCAVAVRKPNKEIEVRPTEIHSIKEKYPFLKLPILRGIVSFVESLVVGMETLTFSASFIEEEVEDGDFIDRFLEKHMQGTGEKVIMGITIAISVVVAILGFMILPYALSEVIKKFTNSQTIALVAEGIIRIGLFLGYMVLISQMQDIQRVFMYHGAEHKTINCLEHGDDLTVENVAKHSRLHKRCGTSFLFLVVLISIFVFFFIRFDSVLLKAGCRLLLVPVIAGISYEFLQLAGKSNTKLADKLSRPGMCLQYLTTREPDADMIEVAIRSVEEVLDWKTYVEAVRKGEIED
ncbi:MAG: DUF1385 domain-containing protein [Lachnospiraceae bacterium]|nr:DUF1385 domain-containing protein [Lachnospiraceae bacterium]